MIKTIIKFLILSCFVIIEISSFRNDPLISPGYYELFTPLHQLVSQHIRYELGKVTNLSPKNGLLATLDRNTKNLVIIVPQAKSDSRKYVFDENHGFVQQDPKISKVIVQTSYI